MGRFSKTKCLATGMCFIVVATLGSVFAPVQAESGGAAFNGGTGPIARLIDQGTYWQAHQRGDLAEQAWRKILGVMPEQPDALLGMGLLSTDRRDIATAREYLAHLRRVAPNHARLDELAHRLGEWSAPERSVEVGSLGEKEKMAAPAVALAYYQKLAATNGWTEARRGFERLARENRQDVRYALVFAQQLTYRESTRLEGISQLERLSNERVVAQEAQKSWREALLWLGPRAEDIHLYQAYLTRIPNDAAIAARVDALNSHHEAERQNARASAAAEARGRALKAGFDALDQDALEVARARFSALLFTNPNEPDALGGLGVVAMREQKFAQARDYLQRASSGAGASRWRTALISATYWADAHEALAARREGDLRRAKALFQRAIGLNPRDPNGWSMLADMQLATGDGRGAEQAWRSALQYRAEDPSAIIGIVSSLAMQGRAEEAIAFIGQLGDAQLKAAGGTERLRAEVDLARGRDAQKREDFVSAKQLFEDAIRHGRDDVWIRLDLARIYLLLGETRYAKQMMSEYVGTHLEVVDVLHAGAIFSAETQDWAAGLTLMERISHDKRTSAMVETQNRLWLHVQIALADQATTEGRSEQGVVIRQRAASVARQSAEFTAVLAESYLKAGEPQRALSMMQGALERSPKDPGLWLQYAGMLEAASVVRGPVSNAMEASLEGVMRDLSRMPLSVTQRHDFENLNIVLAVRRADTTRLAGDLASSYEILAPWLRVRPLSADLQAALGRIYASSGDYMDALLSYKVALTQRPDDLEIKLAAINVATNAREFSFAETCATSALRGAPNDARVLAAVGRMHRARGDLIRAADFLQRALAADPSRGTSGLSPSRSMTLMVPHLC
ncbi:MULTISPECIES: tetratricopeptide repeat protein [unclassified Caballeronia]|uniref:tetratricopeptide repeat protein n=1 Tax=unclassified Caballeronia TaxID=2646786 RepID=UPI0020290649|nr:MULTISPECIES: tetratricopeptide repeat protein [unclassified Caballeronia]